MSDTGSCGDGRPAPVTIYTLPGCGACHRARRLLHQQGIAFGEISMADTPGFRDRLRERTGRGTVPQILIDDEPIGGADDLARLDRRGVLIARVTHQSFPRPVLTRRLSPWRIARWVLTAPLGSGCGPWRHTVELIDRDGRAVECVRVGSEVEGRAVLAAMDAEPADPAAPAQLPPDACQPHPDA